MKAESKYNLGEVFYCPRSYRRTRTVTKEIDGEIWERREAYFSPEVKMLRIIRIEFNIKADSVDAAYYCEARRDPSDEWEDEGYFRVYSDKILDRAYDNYEQAIEKATEYAVHKKREYFG